MLANQKIIYDTSSMCAVAMNTPKGNLFLDSESSMQMFLIGGFGGEAFNQWLVGNIRDTNQSDFQFFVPRNV